MCYEMIIVDSIAWKTQTSQTINLSIDMQFPKAELQDYNSLAETEFFLSCWEKMEIWNGKKKIRILNELCGPSEKKSHEERKSLLNCP